jgi:dTDP-4-amino-4,6-dideoxygalactose transaminase
MKPEPGKGVASRIGEFTFFRGRVALFAILKELGVGKGDEVAVPAYTCVAVPEAVLASGARPIYVDLEATGLATDAVHCDAILSSRTKAIVVQHTFGIPARVAAFVNLGRQRGVPIIEDCCHTFSSTYKGREVGTFGDAAFYSFEWGKPIVAGLGGSLVCRNAELEHRVAASYASFKQPSFLRDLRLRAQYYAFSALYRPSLYWMIRDLKDHLTRAGLAESNYSESYGGVAGKDFGLRMARSCRARLIGKMRALARVTQNSRFVCERYRTEIRGAIVGHVEVPAGTEPVYARYPLWTEQKGRLLALARKARVELAGWYATPIHPLARDEWESVAYVAGSCPNAELRVRQIVTLPTHSRVSPRDIERTVRFFDGVTL